MFRRHLFPCLLAMAGARSASAQAPVYPKIPKVDHVDVYLGTKMKPHYAAAP
jgi:hypothetical protein